MRKKSYKYRFFYPPFFKILICENNLLIYNCIKINKMKIENLNLDYDKLPLENLEILKKMEKQLSNKEAIRNFYIKKRKSNEAKEEYK